MIVEKDKLVAVSYELIVDGQLADKAGSDKPLEYVHGNGMLLPKFEAELEGKQPGDSFAFTLTPEEGYGEYDERYKVVLPKETFEVDGTLREDLMQVGKVIPMLNGEGQVVQGTVAAISDEGVTMDFNHPMAGKTLNFSGKIEDVRENEGHHCCGKGGCHKGNCHEEGEGGCGCHGEGECGCEGGCDCEK